MAQSDIVCLLMWYVKYVVFLSKMFIVNLTYFKEPISHIQIMGHPTNNPSIFTKVNFLKNQIKGLGALLAKGT